MFTVLAFHAGKIAANNPDKSAKANCIAIVLLDISKTGNSVPVEVRNNSAAGKVKAIPTVPPKIANKHDSIVIKLFK